MTSRTFGGLRNEYPRRTMQRALPLIAVVSFLTLLGVVLLAARGTWGYDFLAYTQAAGRLLDGEPLYDPGVDLAGGFAIYLYPPPFAIALVPFSILPDGAALWLWTVILAAAVVGAVAVMPVPATVRWIVLLLAGLSWPVLYAIRLGQVGPILLLLFALSWRCLERPLPFGAAVAAGGLVKVQPGLLAGWAILTGRWRGAVIAVGLTALVCLATSPIVGGIATWADYFALLRRVSAPVTTPHNSTLGAVLFQMGLVEPLATAAHGLVVGAAVAISLFAALRRSASASFVVAVVATQLVSPLLWDHYALVLLLPVAWLLRHDQWWAVLVPLATALPLVGVTPPIAYPVVFLLMLVAPVVVKSAEGDRGR